MLSADRPLRVVFMGTPAVAVPVLSALLDEGHGLVGVYTQPDRQSGRGKRIVSSMVKQYALERGLPVFQPATLRRDEAAREQMASLSPDLIVVAAYGLFLPADTLSLPPLGCLNLHPSLLPRYRGATPVASAILEGDPVTGVTIIRLDQGMDTGPVVAQKETSIGPDETTEGLTSRLFLMGAALLVEVLPDWQHGKIRAQAQDASLATVTERLSKDDGEIDWTCPAVWLARQVRAYHPWPGSFTHWNGKTLKVLAAKAIASDARPTDSQGLVKQVPEGVGVATGEGALVLEQVQMEGRRPVSTREFVQGHRNFIGSRLGAGAA